MNKKIRMLILTSVAGNAVEWYDFALYGYFASILSKIFFPSQNELVSLMLIFSVFASGFIVRPVGGAIFGHLGDKYGRKTALVFSIALITIPTTLMGMLPGYATIGITAPILFTLLRLLQGIAVSGELTGTGIFLVESAKKNRRGLYGSLTMCSTYIGLLIGSAVGALMTVVFNEEQMMSFAWRIPFLLSFILGMAALFLRLKCSESNLFLEAYARKQLVHSPLKETLLNYSSPMVWTCLMGSSLAVAIYLMIGYLPAFFVSAMKISLKNSMLISFIGLLALTIFVPLMGALSDRIERRYILGFGALGFIVLSYFIFLFASSGNLVLAVLAELLIAFFLSPIASTLIVIMSEEFPTPVRYTGISIGYNISMTLFGGTTPLIAIYLMNEFQSFTAPAYYLMVCGLLTLLGLSKVKTGYRHCMNGVSYDY